MLQYKNTWSIYSVTYFFVQNYKEFIMEKNLCIMNEYLNCVPEERDAQFTTRIHENIFII